MNGYVLGRGVPDSEVHLQTWEIQQMMLGDIQLRIHWQLSMHNHQEFDIDEDQHATDLECIEETHDSLADCILWNVFLLGFYRW